eukprot:TRINITY_DN1422_c1_g1_i1.p1 TRINITY_DN1422_c1_g1~~TRINITY_DN1422_c1_g1_i1.p1  ORF type:complete len:559 (+),score=136.48 TRINITY_DN1422_c1_g1_i1:61-1737(+)
MSEEDQSVKNEVNEEVVPEKTSEPAAEENAAVPKEEVKDEVHDEVAATPDAEPDRLINEAFGLEEKAEPREIFMDDEFNAKLEAVEPPAETVKEEVDESALGDEFDDLDDDENIVKKKTKKRERKTSTFETEEEAWQDMLLDYDGNDEVIKSISKINASTSIIESRPATKTQIDSITLGRSRDLAEHCHYYFFEDLVKGTFVRAVARNSKPVLYALFEVIGCEPTGVNPVNGAALKYQVDGTDTDWLLICKTGKHVRKIRLSHVSNSKATDKEFVEYVKRMKRNELPLITQKQSSEVRKNILKIYDSFYNEPLTEDRVEKIVLTRQRLRGNASVNLIKNKIIIQNQLEQLSVQRMTAEERGEHLAEGDLEQRHLELELEETEKKLQSVLYGQNSSFGTLAALTLRNAEANKGREEAEDPLDAVVFGRKQGRSGKSYWSVGKGGFEEKKQGIDMFWKKKKQEEQAANEEADLRRKTERKRGTCPIKDVGGLLAEACASTQGSQVEDPESLLSQPSPISHRTTQKLSQNSGSKKSAAPTPTKTKRRLALSDIRKRLRPDE